MLSWQFVRALLAWRGRLPGRGTVAQFVGTMDADSTVPDWAYEPFEILFNCGGTDDPYAFPAHVNEQAVFATMVHAGYGKLPRTNAVTFFKARHSSRNRVRVRFESVNLNAADGGARNIRIVRAARAGQVINHEYFKRTKTKDGAGTTVKTEQSWVRGELNRKFSQLDPLNTVTVTDRDAAPTDGPRQ